MAGKGIKAGQELVANYADHELLRLPRVERRRHLLESHLFECECSLCASSSSNVQRSDTNRQELATIVNRWNEGLDRALERKGDTLRETIWALQLAKAEGLLGELADIWTQAFYVHAAYGEYKLAKRAAKKALKALGRTRGVAVAQRHWIRNCADDPKWWGSYGVCVRDASGEYIICDTVRFVLGHVW